MATKVKHTHTGIGKRKKFVSLCDHCFDKGIEKDADFVWFNLYPCTDLGHVGSCHECHTAYSAHLLEMFSNIMKGIAKLEITLAKIHELEEKNNS